MTTRLINHNIKKAATISPLAYSLTKNKNLYQAVACLPNGGIDGKVVPRKWLARGYKDCYYLIRSAKLEENHTRGEVHGTLVWKGEVKQSTMRIMASLKNYWEPIL